MTAKRNSVAGYGREGEAGFGLIESIIGLLVLTIVLLAGGQLLRVHAAHLELVERARSADTLANDLMNSLAASNLSALPDANPFIGYGPTDALPDGAAIKLDGTACLASLDCDQVARVPRSSGTGFDYVTVGWNQSAPAGGTIAYYRGWRVTTIDAAKNLRQLTAVVIPAEPGKTVSDAVEPLALRRTNVVQRQ